MELYRALDGECVLELRGSIVSWNIVKMVNQSFNIYYKWYYADFKGVV